MKLVALIPIKATNDLCVYEGVINRFREGFGQSNVVLGLDENDDLGHHVARKHGLPVVAEAPANPFPICRLWMHMAEYAYKNMSATCTILLGDDIICCNVSGMLDEIEDLMARGIKCIAVRERLHPSWPTFLVTDTKEFVTPFFHDLLCGHFVNQEADPFVFEFFRRGGTASFTRLPYLTNPTGGVEGGLSSFTPPRYKRIQVPWKLHLPAKAKILTVDVCVPMYRINSNFVRCLLELDMPIGCDVRFCVCFDSQPSRAQHEEFRLLEASDSRLRVRVNPENVGASETRNRLMNESHSDWVLFLDDDVIPDRRILVEYCKAIRENPDARGFVGLSEMPRDGRLWTDAIHISCLFFWQIAGSSWKGPVSWGVTANLLVKWDAHARFDPRFPKTGGGEDIDFCIQMGHSLIPVAGAKVIHPWRTTAPKMFRRVFEWAIGDGMLNSKYLDLTYRTPPNAVELFIPWMLLSPTTVWLVLAAEAVAQLCMELVLHPLIYRCYSNVLLEEATWPRRLLVVLLAGLVRNTSDAGRLYGQISRCELTYITTKFDWFIGRVPLSKMIEWLRSFSFYAALAGFFTCCIY